MSEAIIVGLIIVASGIVHMVLVLRGNGEAWEYMTGSAFVEIGLGLVLGALVEPGIPRIGVSAFFGLAVLITTILEWKGRRRSKANQRG